MQTTLAESKQPVSRRTFNYPAERLNQAEMTTTSIFENEIPVYVEKELERIYGNLYSSYRKIKENGDLHNVSTYVVHHGGDLETVFLFSRKFGTVTVLNEVIELSEDKIAHFTSTIFSRYPSVNAISFVAIKTELRQLKYPYQKVNYLEDIVVDLPASMDEYHGQLKKNTRRNIKRYSNRLTTNLPAFSYGMYAKEEISEQDVRDIIKLNHIRMSGKNNVSAIRESDTEKMIKMVRECGLICVARNDGKVCAGAISFRVGNNYFLKVLAHDPAYNDYSLGILCCYHIICECINRGGREFHFLWGRYDYKYNLLGVQRDLDYLRIFRSRAHYFLNAHVVASTAARARMRQLTLWLQETKKKDGKVATLVGWLLKRAQTVKKLKMSLAQ
jgi:hypothetical protein